MRLWLFSLLGALALAPVGALIALVIAYTIVGWRGVNEHQGCRGMLAFLYALILGIPLGAWTGFKFAHWLFTLSAAAESHSPPHFSAARSSSCSPGTWPRARTDFVHSKIPTTHAVMCDEIAPPSIASSASRDKSARRPGAIVEMPPI
jgi:hypothetical protein